jgi:hypothetical protein
MKKSLLPAVLSLYMMLAFVACKKDEVPDPVPTPKTIEQLLTATTWKLEEARFLQNNNLTYYKRGLGASIYDVDSIRFNLNNTGKYVNSGGTTQFTWEFLDAQKTKIKLTHSSTFIVNWENIVVTETAFRYSEYYILPAIPPTPPTIISMGGFYRTPR